MIIINKELTALFPFFLFFLNIITLTLLISYSVTNVKNLIFTAFSIFFSFLSLFFIINKDPIDINYLLRIDKYSIFYSKVFLVFSFIICIMSYSSLKDKKNDHSQFYLLILLSTLGCIFLTTVNNLISLCIGIELVNIPLLGLICCLGNYKQSLSSTIKYMVLSSISFSFLLFGIALTYLVSSGLSFFELQRSLNYLSNDNLYILLFGIGFIFISFAFKLSIFPFGLWIPDIYNGMHSIVLSYFSTLSKLSIFVSFVRLILYIPYRKGRILYYLLEIMAFFSILFGNIMALFESNFKKLMSYSSMSNFGYLLAVLLSFNSYPFFLDVIAIYICSYLASNIGIFFIMNLVSINNKKKFKENIIASYKGLFWKDPFLAVSLTIMLFSLSGIPINLGFISKFLLFFSIFSSHLFFLSFVVFFSTLLSFYYYFKIIVNLYYFSSECEKVSFFTHIKTIPGFIIFLLDLFLVFFGFFPSNLIVLLNDVIVFL
ncbi:NADH-quinone oxidoreductase subunit N [Buchnera aphidicola (Tetraneura ulmi)]|uniref:NADH-quinone oxidoreductase subunit N n=1 Tax=Buchnera aphidicola TaxID=9 RepID=UPI003463E8B9